MFCACALGCAAAGRGFEGVGAAARSDMVGCWLSLYYVSSGPISRIVFFFLSFVKRDECQRTRRVRKDRDMIAVYRDERRGPTRSSEARERTTMAMPRLLQADAD